ncbi:hypothetical protein NLX71_25460 [Paenibacillus sp. MZ04-78.2]|uniref:hypothetical protein n=1 Tax=Paenibacillus sp. MZ04-78.2 TaxID=2962034 RepID=UPI0020B8226C|nr:hypothetical protein [Paenibacillus sp. MZ04-78.2]MCP3776597.1 hypothetical protein [Paenibacillus sp. MZ04-78.2]
MFKSVYYLFLGVIVMLTSACQTSVPTSKDVKEPVKQEAIASDEKISKQVNYIKSSLKLGMTQEEVTSLFGDKFIDVEDNGDLENGGDSFWLYRFFKQDDYKSPFPDYVVDKDGLKERKVGADLFIAWKNKKIHLYSVSYVQGTEVHQYVVRPDGTKEEGPIS